MKTALSGCPIASWALVCLNTRCNPFQTQRWANGMNIDLASALWRALAAICRPAFHLLPSLASVPLHSSSHLTPPLHSCSFSSLLYYVRSFWCKFDQHTWCCSIRFVKIGSILQRFQNFAHIQMVTVKEKYKVCVRSGLGLFNVPTGLLAKLFNVIQTHFKEILFLICNTVWDMTYWHDSFCLWKVPSQFD